LKWSRDRLHNMTTNGQTRDPSMLRVQYLENSWRWKTAEISNNR